MDRNHTYQVAVKWTGDRGSGTSDYRAYGRDHTIEVDSKPPVPGSADPHYRGDAERYNPEELLVASLSACHMLWYLHLCANHRIIVRGYEDHAHGRLEVDPAGSGRFVEVVLQPKVTISHGEPDLALRLHDEAHGRCFIANSVNFVVRHEPTIVTRPG